MNSKWIFLLIALCPAFSYADWDIDAFGWANNNQDENLRSIMSRPVFGGFLGVVIGVDENAESLKNFLISKGLPAKATSSWFVELTFQNEDIAQVHSLIDALDSYESIVPSTAISMMKSTIAANAKCSIGDGAF